MVTAHDWDGEVASILRVQVPVEKGRGLQIGVPKFPAPFCPLRAALPPFRVLQATRPSLGQPPPPIPALSPLLL